MTFYIRKLIPGNGQIIVCCIGHNVYTIPKGSCTTGNFIIQHLNIHIINMVCFDSDVTCCIVLNNNLLIRSIDKQIAGYLETLYGQSAVGLVSKTTILPCMVTNFQPVECSTIFSNKCYIFAGAKECLKRSVIASSKLVSYIGSGTVIDCSCISRSNIYYILLRHCGDGEHDGQHKDSQQNA